MIKKPIILYEGKYNHSELTKIKKNNRIIKEVDIYKQQLTELFEINNPGLRSSTQYFKQLKTFINYKIKKNKTNYGNWIYFPWKLKLIHSVNENDYFELRTNRNRNMITSEEQIILKNLTIGIVGLSIGNWMALNLVYSGIASTLKLAEKDILETSNLNRIRATLDKIGQQKIDITTQQIYEINPYANLFTFPKGLNNSNLVDFFSEPKQNLIVEAIDDFEIKIRLRIYAKKYKVPVIMLTNLGDNILIDVERYDLNNKMPLFNGLIDDNLIKKILNKKLSPEDKKMIAVKLVGIENIPLRALASVKEIGKTLVARPQLMSTVSTSGGLIPYLVRRMIFGNLKSMRKLISLDNVI